MYLLPAVSLCAITEYQLEAWNLSKVQLRDWPNQYFMPTITFSMALWSAGSLSESLFHLVLDWIWWKTSTRKLVVGCALWTEYVLNEGPYFSYFYWSVNFNLFMHSKLFFRSNENKILNCYKNKNIFIFAWSFRCFFSRCTVHIFQTITNSLFRLINDFKKIK